MQNDAQARSVSAEAIKRDHEFRNPPISRILLVAGLVALMTAVCLGVVWLTMGWLSEVRPLDRSIEARGVVAAPHVQLLNRFPTPNLQINPSSDLATLRAREESELNTYGWIDRTNGILRIPIERAMALLVQRGVPVRASNAPARTGKSSLELIRERSQGR